MSSRRQFARAAGRGIVAGWLATRWNEIESLLAQPPAASFQFLQPADAADLEAMAAQIIPSDETPGAREAGVIHFIDRALTTFGREDQVVVRQGLNRVRARIAKRWGSGVSFATLRSREQVALLERLEKDDPEFFDFIRGATIVGMFANPSRGGNRGKVGWRLIGFQDRFFWRPPFGDYDR